MTQPDTLSLSDGIKPISRRHVSAEVARQIQQLIASRNLREGDRLPTERELAAALEVGRGAVREGLKFLAGLEIVDIRQGSGIFVKKAQQLVLLDASHLDSEERRQLLEQATTARAMIDCAATELAARKASPEDLAALRAYLVEADKDPVRTKLAHAIDLNFETMIGRMTGNPYIVALQGEAHRYFRSAWESAGLMPRPATERSNQHWEILSALEEQDALKARLLMERHLHLQALSR
ncbi:MAG TPA: FCD domain-containing protein [Alphaproteobacteria bacterium]|nr:FCD domain-containing protein [Alphaproteobacteria bacterium]